MPPLWTATIDLSPELAQELITEQFPELAPANLAPMGVGFDNSAFLVNGQALFRFPRREVAVPLIEREIRVLPMLAPFLSQPIPYPRFIGVPMDRYPYPFAGYPYLPGQTACQIAWTDTERTKNAADLALFLKRLHRIPVSDDTLSWAPSDEIGRANLTTRAPIMKERILKVAERLPDVDAGALITAIDLLKETPPYTGPSCWVHGDLYPRHLLVDESHHLCGVIDWGDVHIGDPAIDLSIAFTFLPPEARSVFRATYEDLDDAMWDRARFRALSYAGILFLYGEDVGDATIQALGEYACRNALNDGWSAEHLRQGKG